MNYSKIGKPKKRIGRLSKINLRKKKQNSCLEASGKIVFAGPEKSAPPVEPDAEKIDALGGTILPGLVEAHFHPTYFDVAALEDLDIKYPVEYVTLLAAANAKPDISVVHTGVKSAGCENKMSHLPL